MARVAWREHFRRRSRRLTGPRQAILELLQLREKPFSIKEILSSLAGARCDLATVYRLMHLLEKDGLVKRFDFGEGAARFQLIADGDDKHHHHLICTRCAEVVPIDECFPNDLEKQIARENGFKSVTHRLDFFGVCPECQTK